MKTRNNHEYDLSMSNVKFFGKILLIDYQALPYLLLTKGLQIFILFPGSEISDCLRGMKNYQKRCILLNIALISCF